MPAGRQRSRFSLTVADHARHDQVRVIERRAQHLVKLESEKWEIPGAGPLPRWQALPLERCTVVKAAKQSMAEQAKLKTRESELEEAWMEALELLESMQAELEALS